MDIEASLPKRDLCQHCESPTVEDFRTLFLVIGVASGKFLMGTFKLRQDLVITRR